MQELEEILKVSNINVIVDCTDFYDVKLKKYYSGLIFSKIFGKDISLWSSRGVFEHKNLAGKFKWLCGFRSEAVGREARCKGHRAPTDPRIDIGCEAETLPTKDHPQGAGIHYKSS
jgi:hypothetical protein